MGFWSSLVEGAKSAGGWVLDHAGDIAGAVGTVAKIAGAVVVLEDGTIDHAAHLDEFQKNFKQASFKLQQAAKRSVIDSALDPKQAAFRASIAGDYSVENVNLDSFTGVWKSPTVTVAGKPPIPMYSDVSKWLAALGVPASKTDDMALYLAQTLFANKNEDKSSASADGIQTVNFSTTDPNGDYTLDVAHSYYVLPMQEKVSETCWHSCVYGKFHPSNKSVAMKALNRRRGNISTTYVRVNTVAKGEVAKWVINATVDWGTTLIAAAIADSFRKAWDSAGKADARSVVASSLQGTSQIMQLQARHSDDPSSIRQALIRLAATTLTKYMDSQGGTPGGDAPGGKPGGDAPGGKPGDDDDGTDGTEIEWVDAMAVDGIDVPPVMKNTFGGNGRSTAVRISASASDVAMPTSVPQVFITKTQIVFTPAPK